MITFIYQGMKRLFFGATNVFAVRSGSCGFNGSSLVTIYHERTKYPLRIIGIQFQCNPDVQGEWRICVNGEKIFPFSEVNPLDSEFRNLIPIDIAAGSLLEIEVKSRNPDQKGVVILEEMDVVEMR